MATIPKQLSDPHKPRNSAKSTPAQFFVKYLDEELGWPVGVRCINVKPSAGLQACDYLLWALQRFYERTEERYLHAMLPKFVRVLDLDAPAPKTKRRPVLGGVEFNEKHPLTLESRAGVWNKDREI